MEEGFDMTIRRVGKVTAFLFRQDAQSGFKIPLLGVGGEFRDPGQI